MAKNDDAARWVVIILGVLNAVLGAMLFWGGLTLARLGGSWYYLIVGIGLVASAGLLIRRRDSGAWLYALIVAGTILWSLRKVGLSFWRLLPRLDLFIGFGMLLSIALFWSRFSLPASKRRWKTPMIVGAPVVLATVLLVVAASVDLGGSTSLPNTRDAEIADPTSSNFPTTTSSSASAGDWLHWGRTAGGLRFSPLTQITKDNVKNLKVAWVFHTGAIRTTSESHRGFTFDSDQGP